MIPYPVKLVALTIILIAIILALIGICSGIDSRSTVVEIFEISIYLVIKRSRIGPIMLRIG